MVNELVDKGGVEKTPRKGLPISLFVTIGLRTFATLVLVHFQATLLF